VSFHNKSGKKTIQAKINTGLGFFSSEVLTQICSPIHFGTRQNKMVVEWVQNRGWDKQQSATLLSVAVLGLPTKPI